MNRKVIINRISFEQINGITLRMNEILKTIQDWYINKLKSKLDVVQEEIVNPQYVVHGEKVEIVKSFNEVL